MAYYKLIPYTVTVCPKRGTSDSRISKHTTDRHFTFVTPRVNNHDDTFSLRRQYVQSNSRQRSVVPTYSSICTNRFGLNCKGSSDEARLSARHCTLNDVPSASFLPSSESLPSRRHASFPPNDRSRLAMQTGGWNTILVF